MSDVHVHEVEAPEDLVHLGRAGELPVAGAQPACWKLEGSGLEEQRRRQGRTLVDKAGVGHARRDARVAGHLQLLPRASNL